MGGIVFDYHKAADEARLSRSFVSDLEREVRKEFDNDEMLFELHMLRAINEYKTSVLSEKATVA
jgi:hypothetical protein